MTFERQAYELPEIWQDTWFATDDQARCDAVASLIPPGVDTLLDVGCGNGMFVNRLAGSEHRRFARLAAVDRSAAALAHVRVARCRATIDALPFGDGSFDAASSMEVLEHLPVAIFPRALSELARVARRYVLVSVPYQQDLASTMRSCPSCQTRFNADYHMRSFDESRINALLDGVGYRLVTSRLIGPRTRYLDRLLRERIRGWLRPEGALPSYAICPMCGWHDADALRRESASRQAAHAAGVVDEAATRPWMTRWRPSVTTFQWISAVYERR